jgi:uncharacterized membrane protein
MRDFRVIFKRVSFMCDNTSAIYVARNLVLHKRMRHLETRHHFLRDHVEKRDIEMRYIDTERQLADIFIKPLDTSHFGALWGVVFVILMAWFEGSLFSILYICILLFFCCIFSYSPKLFIASLVILACIWLIMLIIVLG